MFSSHLSLSLFKGEDSTIPCYTFRIIETRLVIKGYYACNYIRSPIRFERTDTLGMKRLCPRNKVRPILRPSIRKPPCGHLATDATAQSCGAFPCGSTIGERAKDSPSCIPCKGDGHDESVEFTGIY